MKSLKICSFAVALLLLVAPSALSAVECSLGPSLREIRMESKAEFLGHLTVTCTWAAGDFAQTSAPSGAGTSAVKAGATAGVKFDLEVGFNGKAVENPVNIAWAPALLLPDVSADNASGTPHVIREGPNAGMRLPIPRGEVSGSSVVWTDVYFPATWDGSDDSPAGGLSFRAGTFVVDASSVNDDRLNATIVLTSATAGTTIDTEDEADVARIKQALDLEFSEDHKAQKFNACEPGKKDISVNVMEGFRKAWRPGNDIMLMTSSGKIEAKDTGILDVTAEGGADELIIDVSDALNAKDDSTDLAITFEPAMGGSGDITLSAMLLPRRRTDEAFVKSADLVVGGFDVCKGDKLFFPFVTSSSGWDTGIVVVNNSKIDGSCSLNWGNMDLEADEMAALSTIDVDAKDHQAFLVSMERAADYSGSLGVECTFSSATGYVFLSDSANGIGQGYLVKP